jgi:hypothetical protein
VFFILAAALAAVAPAQRAPGTILDIAESLPQFSTLVAVAAKSESAFSLTEPSFLFPFVLLNLKPKTSLALPAWAEMACILKQM